MKLKREIGSYTFECKVTDDDRCDICCSWKYTHSVCGSRIKSWCGLFKTKKQYNRVLHNNKRCKQCIKFFGEQGMVRKDK